MNGGAALGAFPAAGHRAQAEQTSSQERQRALTRVVATMLYGLRPTDSATLVGGALGITAVALLAGYLPVRRATQGSQAAALRIK